ncbi:hypothetical protein L1987_14730 [Smallanthus sonchifolius]|uniref:Uncharacterized protein n=1 Tax=Smallanthus sonchifolius TaxID=185202 RepID=A0ACB9J4M5_9ASTR|nr:hypothetical protein L1987_14730 [Smallanthus sonchifolius]
METPNQEVPPKPNLGGGSQKDYVIVEEVEESDDEILRIAPEFVRNNRDRLRAKLEELDRTERLAGIRSPLVFDSTTQREGTNNDLRIFALYDCIPIPML